MIQSFGDEFQSSERFLIITSFIETWSREIWQQRNFKREEKYIFQSCFFFCTHIHSHHPLQKNFSFVSHEANNKKSDKKWVIRSEDSSEVLPPDQRISGVIQEVVRKLEFSVFLSCRYLLERNKFGFYCQHQLGKTNNTRNYHCCSQWPMAWLISDNNFQRLPQIDESVEPEDLLLEVSLLCQWV